jgi:hypothetical protein
MSPAHRAGTRFGRSGSGRKPRSVATDRTGEATPFPSICAHPARLRRTARLVPGPGNAHEPPRGGEGESLDLLRLSEFGPRTRSAVTLTLCSRRSATRAPHRSGPARRAPREGRAPRRRCPTPRGCGRCPVPSVRRPAPGPPEGPSSAVPVRDRIECGPLREPARRDAQPALPESRSTPRRPRSTWSRVNRERAARMTELGLMTDDGLAAIERAKAARTGSPAVSRRMQEGRAGR